MNVALPAAISLFAGVGGLDLGVGLCLPHRVVCYVEREVYAGSVLVARMETGCLDAAPVWSDVTSFDGRPWRGRVDLLLASPPCQPYSVAGKQLGLADERGATVLEHVARIIGEVEPAAVFLENVAEWITGGHFRDFGEQLQRLGYRVPPAVILAAGDVGAAHRRRRAFILAYHHGVGRERLAEWSGVWDDDAERRTDTDRCGDEVADAERAGSQGVAGPVAQGPDDVAAGRGCGAAVGDAESGGLPGGPREPGSGPLAREPERRCDGMGDTESRGLGEQRDAALAGRGGHADGSVPLVPPGPNDADGWRYIVEQWPYLAPAIESGVLRMAHGVAVDVDRRHRLRACGNGVYPLAAAVALDALLADVASGA